MASTAIDWHFKTPDSISHRPKVLYKDPFSGPGWNGPVELITWGRGYACVLLPTGTKWIPAKHVKPYHELAKPLGQPSPADEDSEFEGEEINEEEAAH